MSQEQQPVRSRRELRQARDEALESIQDAGPTGPGEVSSASVETIAPSPLPVAVEAERSSQIRARDRAALRAIKELAAKEEQLSSGGPATRRQLRIQQLGQGITSANPVVVPAMPGTTDPPGGPADDSFPAAAGTELPSHMTVEQALEARSLITEDARIQLTSMEESVSADPEAVDPEILAQQIALAERAAVLNRRVMAKQKLAEQNSRTPLPRHDPATTSNLAMVTPLEFVQVPGLDRPVMKPPATSYVPVVTSPGPRQQPSGGAAPSTGRSRILARAEEVAKAAPSIEPDVSAPEGEDIDEILADRPRVAAKSAYGLEPLDVVTAGLGRAHRIRLLQLIVLAIGIVAFIAGITMIVSGLSR